MDGMNDRTIMVTAGGMKIFVKHPLSKIESALLWYLGGVLPPSGDIVSNVQLADQLAATPTHIHRAVKRLCEIGLLIRGPKSGTVYHY